MKKSIICVLLFFGLTNGVTADEVYGDWVTKKGGLTIKIEKCKEEVCGILVDFAMNKKNKGRFQKASIGKEILRFHKTAIKNKWRGKMMNLKTGKALDSKMYFIEDSELQIEVCVLAFCKELDFIRK